ncbi:MAG TPA: acetoin utilization protein AcuC [Steroidobacteraceae bacterium]|nr:acetoin utilization protein AcuC [Steroidobacteraceae bacterium]
MGSDVTLVSGDAIAAYGFSGGHPFGPDRHEAFMQEFRNSGLYTKVIHESPRSATTAELESFHESRYVEFVRERCVNGVGYLDGGDTPAQKGLFESASHVVGATLVAVDALMTGRARRAFVPIAGLHHAARNGAAGFCVFNDCGVAVEQLRARYGVQRIAYVDIDAHHGDGMFYGFIDDPDLLFADIHEDGRSLYPGTGSADETGKGTAQGTKLNLPLPAGAGDAEFKIIWQRVLEYVEAGKPEFILLQCGADSLEGDPITHLRLSPAAHALAARDLCSLADRLGHGRVLALGGGGYNRRNLALAWTGVVRSMVESAGGRGADASP